MGNWLEELGWHQYPYSIEKHHNGQITQTFELEGGCVGVIMINQGVVCRAYQMRNGVRHGPWLEFNDGMVSHTTGYIDGLEHGVARQYKNGQLIGSYALEHGCGVDLWFYEVGVIAEEHHLKDGKPHGVIRFWNANPPNTSLWRELWCWNGEFHGVERLWDTDSLEQSLAEGYPVYWVNGRKTSRKLYVQHTTTDPTLPKLCDSDDYPQRTCFSADDFEQ